MLPHYWDQDGALKEANQAYERRAVWLSETMDGVFVLNGTLDAEGGAILRAALAAVEGKPQAGDRRTAPQRRADAMVNLGRHRLDAGDLPTTGCQRPHLTVTADLEVLAGRAAGAGLLNWEQLVPAETVRRLACDCSVTPIVVGADGEPLSVGRARRTIPAPMRRAIMLRDRHCRFRATRSRTYSCRNSSERVGGEQRGSDRGFRPPDPTGACGWSNLAVRSLRDKVSPVREDGGQIVRGDRDCQHQGGRGPG